MSRTCLENQVTLISGSAQGLSEAYARCLASYAATVIINNIGIDVDGTSLVSKVEKPIKKMVERHTHILTQ